jgi:phosphatidylserine/phosphatidylglycerophosphate/cardiolipin synthase-like enzyme
VQAFEVQAFEFTSPLLLHALVAAKRRGADVRVNLDKVNAMDRYSEALPMPAFRSGSMTRSRLRTGTPSSLTARS